MEQVNLRSSGGGPSRGGAGGPCDHCARTMSPCWRKGPPEKPLLCNACGAHYLVKKSLDGYRPGQKQARPAGSSPARSRPRPKYTPNPPAGASTAGVADPPTPDSPFAASAGGNTGRKGGAGEEGGTMSKRQRRANKKHLEGEGAELEGGGAAQRTSVSHRKPKGLTIRRVSRQESMAEIVDTPMAANLLADMADRRKNQAPPPVWELTSPRGIEGARQRTFNALMGSPRQLRRMSSDGMEPNSAACPPTAPHQQHHQQHQQQQQQPLSPSMPVPHANGSAILAEHPYAKRTVLYSNDTPLGLIEMADVVNNKTWRATSTLAHSEASALAALLPECDRSAESAGNSHAGVSSDLFKSAAFQSAMSNFQNLLASGMFDREGPNAGGSKVVDHFRRLQWETNLSASNWRETMPLVGKKRRAAKKRAADEYQAILAAQQGGMAATGAAKPSAPSPTPAAPIAPSPYAQPPVELPSPNNTLSTVVPILRGVAAAAAPVSPPPIPHHSSPTPSLTAEASFLNAEPKPETGDAMPPGLNSSAPLRSNINDGHSPLTSSTMGGEGGGGGEAPLKQPQQQQQGSESKPSSTGLTHLSSDLLCWT